tara:strand:- start:1968 stop:2606 length:639 start_codon:yes stop_codon:yes gene_type:complete
MEIKIRHDLETKWYSVPNTWDDLTLDKYMICMKHLKNVDHNHDALLELIYHLSGIPKKTLYNMTITDVQKIVNVVKDFLQTVPTDKLKHIVKIDGVKYGFNPKLRDISLGEFVDIEHCIKEGMYDNLHTLLSILYRPVVKQKGDKYTIEEYEPSDVRADLFKKNMTVKDFNGASVFFYDLGIQLLDTMSQYLKMEVMKERLKVLQTNGDGMR